MRDTVAEQRPVLARRAGTRCGRCLACARIHLAIYLPGRWLLGRGLRSAQ
jgi:hypothetical protein